MTVSHHVMSVELLFAKNQEGMVYTKNYWYYESGSDNI